MLLLLTQMVLFQGIHVFYQLICTGLLEEVEPFSSLKTVISRKHLLQKLTQFSYGNNVLDVPGATTHEFFQDIHVFLQVR
jgi:hypothetical protein